MTHVRAFALAAGASLLGTVCLIAAQETDAPAPPGSPQVIRTTTGVEMVLIPAGRFKMGSREGAADEAPVHEVSVDALYVDRYEVTQGQYGKLVRGNPSHFKGSRNPLEQASWPAAALYCNARSRAEGFEPCYDERTGKCNFKANGYRLPTEAEWEYACRAGSDAAFSFGDDAGQLGEYAWFDGNSEQTTRPVGQRKPNRWGLYDMHGNVAEWCNDRYDPRYYRASLEEDPHGPKAGDDCVLRGGAWNSPADECRSAYREKHDPGFGKACFLGDHIGFRCVRRAL